MNSRPLNASPLELWGGVECTVNRVHDEYFDQLERSGHAHRVGDLDWFASLNIRTLRYPILWERIAPNGIPSADWSWADERLGRLRELGIKPIVGLVHHGSGPRSTNLLDPAFAERLAEFAHAVAERYPWIESYTPVNEPLTTARFSALYGHWYPHHCNRSSFARALVNQYRAIVLSMRAIRQVNPKAQLVQTEDLGKTYSTRPLAYQAEFENQRRWLTWDTLLGRLDAKHPMWDYLESNGIEPGELEWFLENTCPPDLIGVDHYVTSQRFLDHHLERYPLDRRGGNEWQPYADLAAVRVMAEDVFGPCTPLREAWERYHLPIAITEAHLGGTREEQIRWLLEVWNSARVLRQEGVDIRAVTAWSLLGAYDWDSLLTRGDGHYESGVFDLRAPEPRPTALAELVRELATGEEPSHPVLASAGWWHRQRKRLIYETVRSGVKPLAMLPPQSRVQREPAQPILITGATGTLGYAFARLCHHRGLAHRLLSRAEMDIADAVSVERALLKYKPWAVVNAAGYVRVDDAEREPGRCFRENTEGPAVLATLCRSHGVQLVTLSSDLVFNGRKHQPYVERDSVAPVNVYGKSKAEAERLVLQIMPSALVVRTSAFIGPWDKYNFVTIALRELAAGRPFVAADDALISPTYVPDLVHATLDLLIDGESGIWHLTNDGALTWAEFARMAADVAGLNAALVEGCPTRKLGHTASRPAYSVLGSERGKLMPSLEVALLNYFQDIELDWTQSKLDKRAA